AARHPRRRPRAGRPRAASTRRAAPERQCGRVPLPDWPPRVPVSRPWPGRPGAAWRERLWGGPAGRTVGFTEGERGPGRAGPGPRDASMAAASAEAAAAFAAALLSLAAGRGAEGAAAALLARTALAFLEAHDVLCLEALGLLDDVELDPFAFIQRAEAGALDGRVVDEHVRAAVLLDEAVPLFLREPLHGACGASHVLYLWFGTVARGLAGRLMTGLQG